MKKITTIKTLLVGLLALGATSAWADVVETVVVNQDFNDGTTTLFTGASRMTVSNDNNVKFTCASNSTNGYSLATYDFSSAIGTDATAVKVEFLFWIPNENASYRRFFTVGQADLRTGFAKQAYKTEGSMFAFGLARNSSANYFSINGASTTAAASATSVLGAWARAEIYVDHSQKKVNYKITNVENTTTYYSANDVAFVDNSAAYCNQLDFFDCQNNAVSYLDNLVITKYVDQSKVATKYTVKYQNANGTDLKDAVEYDTYVGDTYTASSNDMATFYSSDENTKYVYASGNASATATGTASDNVITLVFNEYQKVAYTITAKNGEETLETLASGDAYTDGSTTVSWNKFKQFNDQWYETTGSYVKTITEAGNTDVAYTPSNSNIAYFFEAENLSTSRSGFPEASGTDYSGGKARRNYSSGQMWTSAIAEGGVFTLTFPYSMANASSSTIKIKTRDSEGNFTDTGLELTTNTGGTFVGTVSIPAGSSLAIANDNTYNSNILIDYLTLTEGVVVNISDAGYATFCSPYAVDFSESGITAYTATITDNIVGFAPVTKVPANTGVLLKGEKGNYVVPTTTDATAVSDLIGVTEATEIPVGSFVLMNEGGKVGFYKTKNEFTVGANTAYIPAQGVAFVNTRDFIAIDGEATAIKAIETNKQGGEIFNLAGQRVNKAQKGLYIQNGKKVIMK